MERNILLLCLVAVWCRFIHCLPVSSEKDNHVPSKVELYSELTKLRHILDDIEKQGERKHEADDLTTRAPIQENMRVVEDDIKYDDINNDDRDKEVDESNMNSDLVDTDDEMDLAMNKFLHSLSEESLKNLEKMRLLFQESKARDLKDKTRKINKVLQSGIHNDHSDKGYLEYPLTESQEKEANWKNIVRALEKQRDQLYITDQIKKTKDDTKISTEEYEGAFGKFTDEVKAAVEKNLLSDVALAIHSGVSIDDIIEDILGKEKGEIM